MDQQFDNSLNTHPDTRAFFSWLCWCMCWWVRRKRWSRRRDADLGSRLTRPTSRPTLPLFPFSLLHQPHLSSLINKILLVASLEHNLPVSFFMLRSSLPLSSLHSKSWPQCSSPHVGSILRLTLQALPVWFRSHFNSRYLYVELFL